MNIKALQKALPNGAVAFVMSEVNRLYFTEFAASDGFLIVGSTGAKFITDSRYIEAAQKEAVDCEVELSEVGDDLYTQLYETIDDFGGKRLLFEASRLTVSYEEKFKNHFKKYELDFSNCLDNLISELRMVKSEAEYEKLLGAQRIAEQALNETLPLIKPGVKERDIAAELDYRMRKLGASGVSFDTIAVAGENSSKPHGVPGDYAIKNGDFITIDYGAIFEGYHSDTTRTFAVGSVSEEQKKAYSTVLSAQLAGVEALHAGLTARDADAVCRDIIKAAGYGEFFGHSTGHGVGVEIHELPTLSSRAPEDMVLKPGHVVTVEPGIYLPGKFGVRIEDMLMITEDGARNFCSLPKELIVL
ncbi:MAG: aminopeptidase P family protein [Clostridia bacterium]|nr:aminopeptidase P family protein [Clostridia bacterium]